ncbi:MAG: D-cysteine desulfhydrase [Gammaproteobacteria bacterium]|nr:D-cysteine desulfhydrase [Gammaproteobacteria bacterium]
MLLARFPRQHFAHLPTPLEPMERLTALLGGPKLYVKRDDCTGLATGGNKTRKLEFLIADALAQNADTVVTQGATQSNHVRQTAAAAARFGLNCEVLLERRVTTQGDNYEMTGNVLLDDLFGAHREFRAAGVDMNLEAKKHAESVRDRGGKPYVIPGGGSNRIGALGYVDCAMELITQANQRDLQIDWVVHATGSTGTQAGLVAGLEAMHSGLKVYGISVSAEKSKQEEAVFTLAQEVADSIGMRGGIDRSRVIADSDYVGPGYAQPTEAMIEAVMLTARTEGILLDPVYSGKAMAGLNGLVKSGFFRPDETVVFLHTGGSASLFAYQTLFVRSSE